MHTLWLLIRILTHSMIFRAKPHFSLGKTQPYWGGTLARGMLWASKSIENPCLSVAKYSIFQAKTSSGVRLAFQCTRHGYSPYVHHTYTIRTSYVHHTYTRCKLPRASQPSPAQHRAGLHTPREQARKATGLMITTTLWRVGGYVKASPWYTATSLHSNLTLPYRCPKPQLIPCGCPKETKGERRWVGWALASR